MRKPTQVLLLGVGVDAGAGQYSAQLGNSLAKRIDTHVLLPDYDATEFQELLSSEVEVHTFDIPAQGSTMPSRGDFLLGMINRVGILASVIRQIRNIDPSIVHIPFYTAGPLRLYLLPILKAMRTPTVGTVHDPQSHTGQESMLFGIDLNEKERALGGLLLDRTIVHGPETEKQALNAGYREGRLRIVPHGVYTHFPESDVEPELDQLLFFGNIRENKGYDRIPELLDLVAERHPDVSAVVAGDLSDSVDETWGKRTIQRLQDHNYIKLDQGYISMEQAAKYFTESAAVILPYYDASTSGVLRVAYRYCTPVVATDVGDIGYYVKNDGTGLIAANNNVEAIADKTVQLLGDTACRERLVANLKSANEQYSWNNIAEKTIDVYQEALV